MANVNITLYPDHADPELATIDPGDAVTFTLSHRSDAVTVTFTEEGSPFSTDTVHITGGTTLSSSPKTVRADVTPSTTYRYTAPKLVDPTLPGPDQPATMSGGLEVNTSRPPEEPDASSRSRGK